MDECSEITFNTVCCTCLSIDRKLTKLSRVEEGVNNLFFLLSFNSETCEAMFNKGASFFSICWECKATLDRLQRFREQVRLAQRQLSDIMDGRNHDKLNSLSKLQYFYQDKYNCVINNEADSDNFIDCGPDIASLNTDSDPDDVPLADLFENVKCIQTPLTNDDPGRILEDKDNKTNTAEYSKFEMTEEEMFESRTALKLEESYVNSTSKCELCVKGFKDYNCLEKHNLKLHVQKAKHIQCDICHIYLKEKYYKKHKQNHYMKYVCNLCDAITFGFLKMEGHLRIHGIKIGIKKVKTKKAKTGTDKEMGLICTECDKYFENKNIRYKHMQKYHRQGFKCSTCGKTFAFRNTLTRHERLHSSPLPREQCPVCGKLIRTDLTRAHAQTHTHRQRYSCVACDKSFISRASYENHLKYARSHAVQDVLKYKCSQCKKGYRSRGELRDHINYQHIGRTLHKCPICNKALANRRCITRHVNRAHRGLKENARDNICQTCGKTFRDKKCLREHELIHTGEKPLSCDICGRSFRQSASLYTHRRRVHNIVNAQRVVVHEGLTDQT